MYKYRATSYVSKKHKKACKVGILAKMKARTEKLSKNNNTMTGYAIWLTASIDKNHSHISKATINIYFLPVIWHQIFKSISTFVSE